MVNPSLSFHGTRLYIFFILRHAVLNGKLRFVHSFLTSALRFFAIVCLMIFLFRHPKLIHTRPASRSSGPRVCTAVFLTSLSGVHAFPNIPYIGNFPSDVHWCIPHLRIHSFSTLRNIGMDGAEIGFPLSQTCLPAIQLPHGMSCLRGLPVRFADMV